MVRALFECKTDGCGEKAIVEDGTIPRDWTILSIAQNMLIDEDEEEYGTFEISIEFCSMEHAAQKIAQLSTSVKEFRAQQGISEDDTLRSL